MVKIRCVSLDGGSLFVNQYKGISGEEYTFQRGTSTNINNREDAEYFLKAGNGQLFKKVTKTGELIENLKDALVEVAKELPLPKKKKEEKVDEIPIEEQDKSKPELKPGESIEEKPIIVKHTEKEVWDMSKKEQINLLNELGAKKIPKLEKGRVKIILELEQKA